MIERARFLWFGVFLSSLLLSAPILGGEDRDQLVATARDGNRAAILSIISLECRYERRPWANTNLEQAKEHFHLFSPGRFWQSNDVYRHLHRIEDDGATLDFVVRNGRGHYLRKGGAMPYPTLALETLPSVSGVGGWIWQWLLFSHWGRKYISYYPIHEILEQPHVIRTAERLPPPDKNIHIELTHDSGRLEFWFDPKVNYLVRKSVMIPAGDKTLRWEDEVIEFLEDAPAIFVPTVIEHRCFVKGTLQAVLRTILSDVKVNKPLAKDAFRLPGIAGMECIDVNREVRYKVDADGNPIGSEIPNPVYRVGSPPSNSEGPPIVSEKRSSLPQPSKPPTPGWIWLLIVSIGVLVAAVILAIVSRRKQSAQV